MDAKINTIMENLRALAGRESIDSIRTHTRFDHINITDWSVNETILKPCGQYNPLIKEIMES
jgi:hypothetical protein